jgi:hypothetical protein
MHDAHCPCSAHDPNGTLERVIQHAQRANSLKLKSFLDVRARIRHSAEQTTLDRLAASSGMG